MTMIGMMKTMDVIPVNFNFQKDSKVNAVNSFGTEEIKWLSLMTFLISHYWRVKVNSAVWLLLHRLGKTCSKTWFLS